MTCNLLMYVSLLRLGATVTYFRVYLDFIIPYISNYKPHFFFQIGVWLIFEVRLIFEYFQKIIKRIQYVIIPSGMTKQLQLLDVSIEKPFKDYLKMEYTMTG